MAIVVVVNESDGVGGGGDDNEVLDHLKMAAEKNIRR